MCVCVHVEIVISSWFNIKIGCLVCLMLALWYPIRYLISFLCHFHLVSFNWYERFITNYFFFSTTIKTIFCRAFRIHTSSSHFFALFLTFLLRRVCHIFVCLNFSLILKMPSLNQKTIFHTKLPNFGIAETLIISFPLGTYTIWHLICC